MTAQATETDQLRTGLRTALEPALGDGVTIERLAPLSMGASRDMWSFEARTPMGLVHRLVLRRDPPTAPRPDQMRREESVLRAAAGTGAPVPAVIASGLGDDGVGSPYVVMQHVDGETIPRKILRDEAYAAARAAIPRQLGRIAAQIHTIPRSAVPDLAESDTYAEWIEEYRQSGPPSPALEIALRWLDEHRPEPGGSTVVHGDYRMGNVIVDEHGIAAVLDWELAHVGDPIFDLGWACAKAWRFGAPHPVAGVGEIDELVDGYAEVAGWRPAPEAVLWWQVFGSFRWATMCRRQADRHLSGSEHSLELAMIGRRFAENEYDLLLALGLTEPRDVPDPLGEMAIVSDAVFGQPTASQLLSALSSTLHDSRQYADRLARNTVDVVHRELLLGSELRSTYADALAAHGCASEVELAERLRSGRLTLTDDVLDAVRLGVEARLTVWNPRHLASR